MDLIIDLKKSIEENASDYFDESKKLKKKAERAQIAVDNAKQKLEKLAKKHSEKQEKEQREQALKEQKKASKKWHHKFRWFNSSEGFLVIGGRDATSNEVIIKKHTDKNDVVFHTEAPGSPFVVIKTEGEKPGEQTLKEAAEFTATYSSEWKRGILSSEVFHVNPNQVSKEAQSGEYIAKGAFMIYGKKNLVKVQMNLAIGITKEQEVMAGPLSAIKKHCKEYAEIVQGNDKLSDVAKKIKTKLGAADLDDIIRVLPQGIKLKK